MDRTLYACYYIEDVYAVATSLEYFDYVNTTWDDPVDPAFSSEPGYALFPKPGYTLSGKITLPSTINGKPVVALSGFNGQSQITHIYWKGTPQCRTILDSAFSECISLKFFQLPETIRRISRSAFAKCSMLSLFDLSQTKVYLIDQAAFNAAFKAASCDLFIIPGSVSYLGGRAFSYNSEIAGGILTLQIGGPGDPSRLDTIGLEAVIQNSYNPVKDLVIYVEDDSNVPTAITEALSKGDIQYTGQLSIVKA